MLQLIPLALIGLGVYMLAKDEAKKEGKSEQANSQHGAGGVRGDRGREQRSDGAGHHRARRVKTEENPDGMVSSAVAGDSGSGVRHDRGGKPDATSRHRDAEPVTNGDTKAKSGSASKSSKSAGRSEAKKAQSETGVESGKEKAVAGKDAGSSPTQSD